MQRETLTIWAGPDGVLSGSRLPWPARVVTVAPEAARATALRVDGLRELLGEHGLALDSFGAVYLGGMGRGVVLVEHLLGDPETMAAGVFLGDPAPGRFERVARFVRDAARGYGRALVVSTPPHHCRAYCELPALRLRPDGLAGLGGFVWQQLPSDLDLAPVLRARLGDLTASAERVSAA